MSNSLFGERQVGIKEHILVLPAEESEIPHYNKMLMSLREERKCNNHGRTACVQLYKAYRSL